MPTNGLPIADMIKLKMHYLQTRQGVLSQNVANAETPGYHARDLKALKFQKQFQDLHKRGIDTARTDEGHIKGKPIRSAGPRFGIKIDTWETTPEGNSVVLEEEMMKSATNQLDYQTTSNLYQKTLSALRIGIRKPQ